MTQLVFDETSEKYQLIQGDKPKDDEAHLEARVIPRGITGLEVMGVPIGAAAVGGATAFVVDGLFDRFLPQVTGSMANLVAAWALVQFGSRVLGRDVTKYAAIFLAYEAVRDPIENVLGGLVGGDTARQAQSYLNEARKEASMKQKSAVGSGYYDSIFAGG